MNRRRIDPQCGVAFEIAHGDTLRIIDVEGEQVADLMAFAKDDVAEWLSSGRTIDYANTIYLTTGDVLYSNRSNPMMTIVNDSVGRHDFLYTPCSRDTFRLIYGTTAPHPSCYDNLATSLRPYGIDDTVFPPPSIFS